MYEYQKRTDERELVTVDLRAEQLVKNKKNGDVAQCLRRLGSFTLIAAWEPPTVTICPSSLAKYFSGLGFEVALCTNRMQWDLSREVRVPVVSYENEEDVMDVVEWMGTVAMKCPESYCDTFLSSYATPTPNVGAKVETCQFRGLFTAKRIIKFIEAMNISFKDHWYSIYVQGFSDSPVNWHLNEHHYYTNGDNGYLFLFNRYKYMFATMHTSNKRYK